MASFRIHEDQENAALGLRKDNADTLLSASQRRALGDLSHFACNQNRNSKLPGLTNGTNKVIDESRVMRQLKNEKNIVPPVAQFRAFSVYEDKPSEVEVKKREPTFKPYVSKDLKKEHSLFTSSTESTKPVCNQVEKVVIEQPKVEIQVRPAVEENKEKDDVGSPMSVADSSILSVSVTKSESQILEDIIEEEDDKEVITARNEREMIFHVVEYRDDIYQYMREIEVKHRANPRYMRKQPDITHVMRSILVDWLVEVCDEYGQQSETLHLAVSYVDRFLSYMSVIRTKLQLVGTAATYIAAKYEEVYPPEVSEFVYITDDTYTKHEVLRMEHLILKVLSFDLSTPTSLAFLSQYCISNGLSKKIFHLAAYIAELSLLEADPYLQFKPSIIAASALATARHCLLCPHRSCDGLTEDGGPHESCSLVAWPAKLERATGYSMSDLAGCARHLARTHAHAYSQPYRAILDKYKTNKFDGVSMIEPRPMFPVPPYCPPAAPAAARPAAEIPRPA